MKRYLAILLVMAMLLCLCACGGKDGSDDAAQLQEELLEEAAAAEPAPEAEAPAAVWEPVTAELGDYTVTVLGAEAFEDADDAPALRVYYDFTNNSDMVVSAWGQLSFYVEQDGYELNDTYDHAEDDVDEYGNDMLNVIPGVTIRCIAEYTYKPDGGVVSFTMEEWDTEETLVVEIDPQNLSGRPGALEFPTIDEPTWTQDMPLMATLDDAYDVEIIDYEVVEGYDGDILRVYVDFTNNSDEATSLWLETYYMALQDGVELEYDFAVESVEEEENASLDIEPGTTITCAITYELRTDSPVEVMIYDNWEETFVGTVCYLD